MIRSSKQNEMDPVAEIGISFPSRLFRNPNKFTSDPCIFGSIFCGNRCKMSVECECVSGEGMRVTPLFVINNTAWAEEHETDTRGKKETM